MPRSHDAAPAASGEVRRSSPRRAAGVLALAVLVAACGDDDISGPNGDNGNPALDADEIITVTDYAFSPASMTRPVGHTFWFSNNGSEVHRPASVTGPEWDAGDIPPGEGALVTLEGTGLNTFACLYHDDEHGMRAILQVE